MKLRNLFMAVVAGAAMLVGCNKEVDLGPAKVALDQTTLAFEAAGGSQEVSLTASRDWAVTGVPEWIALSATSGKAAVEAQPLKITVTQNAEYNRSATIVFTIGFARTSLTINQAGPEGEIDNGDGTLENPFTVAGVIEYVNELGADVNSPKKVFVIGKVCALPSNEKDQFGGAGNTYGNGSFTMSDDGTTQGGQFTAYRINYLGNKKFTTGDTPVKVGDEVVVYGNVVNYKGNTPETQQNTAFLYSLNGVDKGGAEGGGEGGGEGEAKGDGSLENPFNPAGIAAVAAKLADNAQSEQSYYIKGKISKIAVSKGVEQTFANSGSFGNASFYISDVEDGTGEFYIYQTYYLDNKKWVSGQPDVAVGDVVVVYGPVTKYVSSYGTTLETVGKGASYIYSHTKGEGGDEPGGDETEYTYEAVTGSTIKVNNEISWSEATDATYGKGFEAVSGNIKLGLYKHESNVDLKTPDQYSARVYVSSVFVVSTVDGSDLTAIEFTASDPYNGTDYAQPLKVLEGGNGTVPANTETKKIGTWKGSASKVVFQATPKQARLVSMTYAPGDGGGDQPGGGDEPGGNDGLTPETAFTASEAIAKATEAGTSGTTDKFYVKGIITGNVDINAQYHNATFDIVDGLGASAVFNIFRLKSFDGANFETTDPLAAGDEVIVYGKLKIYSDKPEMDANGTLIRWNGKTSFDNEPGGGDEPGGNDGLTPETAFTASEAIAKATEAGTSGTTDKFYVKGIITGNVDINAQYHNATFDIVDGLGASAVFNIFRLKSFDGANFETTDPLAAGDEVIVYGKLKIYSDKPEMDANGTLIKWNGKTSFGDEPGGGDQPGGGDEPGGNDGLTPETAFTASEAIAKATEAGTSGTTDKFYVKGIITGNVDINAQYHNATFDIVDGLGASAVFNIFRLKSFDGANFETTDPLAAGDEVIVYGKLKIYSNKPEMDANGTLIKWNGKTAFDDGGDEPGGGGDEPGGEPEGGIYASTVTWTLGEKAYSEKAIVNEVENVPVLKLGNSSTIGTATLTIPSGATKITFYAVSWSGKPSKLVFKNGDTELDSVSPAANTGLANSSPYTLTVTDADKYEIAVSGATSITVQTDGSNKRAALFAIVSE